MRSESKETFSINLGPQLWVGKTCWGKRCRCIQEALDKDNGTVALAAAGLPRAG